MGILCCIEAAASAAEPIWDDGFRVQLTREGQIRSVIVESDQRILILGNFQWVGMKARNGIARLNVDGSLDESFDPGSLIPGTPLAMALLPDGKLLVGARVRWDLLRVYRCLPNGTLDPNFDNAPGFQRLPFAGSDQGMELLALADGRVMVGGFFHLFGQTRRVGLARLMPTGALDLSFDPGTALDDFAAATALALDRDVGYLVAIQPYSASPRFLRLLSTGAPGSTRALSTEEKQRLQLPVLADGRRVLAEPSQLTFYSAAGNVQNVWRNVPVDSRIYSRHYAALQLDGKLLVAGTGADLPDGRANFGLVRLLSGGRVDAGFSMGGGVSVPNMGIHQVTSLADNRVIVRGSFTMVNGVRRSWMVRVHSNGALDKTFELRGLSYPDEQFAVTPSGEVMIGGAYCPPDGTSCDEGLWRLRPDGMRDETFPVIRFECEKISSVCFHPRAGTFVTSYTGGGCWITDPQTYLSLFSARTTPRPADFRLHVSMRSPGGGVLSGSVEHVIPHPRDDTTYVVGNNFTHLNGIPCPGVGRLLRDGTVDPSFRFAHPEPLGWGNIGARVEHDGGLTLLAGDFNQGRLLTINPDGSLARSVTLPSQVPDFSLAKLPCADQSWIVAGEMSSASGLALQRIGPDGRRLAWRAIPFSIAGQVVELVNPVATCLDANEQLVIGAPQLAAINGAWSGLLRVRRDVLAPLGLRLVGSPDARMLVIAGPRDQRVRIETSSDLVQWNEWTEATLELPETLVPIPEPLSQRQLFYRAMLP